MKKLVQFILGSIVGISLIGLLLDSFFGFVWGIVSIIIIYWELTRNPQKGK